VAELETGSLYRLDIVRRRVTGCGRLPRVESSADIYRLFRLHFEQCDREQLCVALLDRQSRLIGFNVVAVGSLDAAVAKPREILKAAILANAAACIVLHNHPSGDITPSESDVAFTRQFRELAAIVGTPLIDHVIFGDDGYSSLAQLGLL
jgi:DNA repair protein RadC